MMGAYTNSASGFGEEKLLLINITFHSDSCTLGNAQR